MDRKISHSSGKRKEAVARATVRPGNGTFRVNTMLLDHLNPRFARERVRVPLLLADGILDLNKIDISVVTSGGGVMGQADAIACSIASALVEYSGSEELHDIYVKYDRTLIAGDHRETEVHKPSQSSKGPRHKRQKSYR
ncbi:MAG: 30S ribosomal protein S9 [Candidatus Altiarchaeales archaeon]|nr:30S ribosomal protein S9 [Candidatus Altiarchaeales archaeon]MBD3415688.1 30S ribosomal protein S9 [Candidatus Altiarchaeales archaeon]